MIKCLFLTLLSQFHVMLGNDYKSTAEDNDLFLGDVLSFENWRDNYPPPPPELSH